MKIKKHLFRFIFVLPFLFFLLQPAGIVQADVAPPLMPPGSNPAPGDETQVQMVAETVIIEVQPNAYPRPETYQDWNLVDDWAMVNATFTMRNQGNQEESMQVWFPLMEWHGMGDGWFNYPEISNFRVFVDNQQVDWTRLTTDNTYDSEDPPIAWAAFDVTFPPGKDVIIVVKYDSQATGYPPFSNFSYILETGAAWKDAIGSADIILRLPYEASIENAAFYDTSGAEYNGNEVRWHFDNLEPTYEDNISVDIVAVPTWQEVINAQKTLEDNPNSGEAYGRLARAYKQAILYAKGFLRDDAGGKNLYEQSYQAYQKALELSPNTARWHAGFAELLWGNTMWESPVNYPVIEQIVRELQTALDLDPQNEQAQNILMSISGWVPEAVQANEDDTYTMLILTATIPYSSATPEATKMAEFTETTAPTEAIATTTPLPSSTPEPSATASEEAPAESTAIQPEPTSTPDKIGGLRLPICGSSLIGPAAIIIPVLSRRRTKK